MNSLLVKLGGVALLLALLMLGVSHWEKSIRKEERALVVAEYTAKISAQKLEAAKELLEATAVITELKQSLTLAKDAQENEDAINTKAMDILADKLHGVASRTGGLFIDPYSAGCGSSCQTSQIGTTPSSGNSSADSPEAPRLLSGEFTEFLEQQTREADEIAIAYSSCRADSLQLRAKVGLH